MGRFDIACRECGNILVEKAEDDSNLYGTKWVTGPCCLPEDDT